MITVGVAGSVSREIFRVRSPRWSISNCWPIRLHEFVERRHEAMHRQHHGGAQPPRDVGDAVERHRVGAVDRHHHDVEPADRGEMGVVELVVQMAEMADAEAGDLEDEDRVAVPDHLAAGIVAVVAADVGGDVADVDVADALRRYAPAARRRPSRAARAGSSDRETASNACEWARFMVTTSGSRPVR